MYRVKQGGSLNGDLANRRIFAFLIDYLILFLMFFILSNIDKYVHSTFFLILYLLIILICMSCPVLKDVFGQRSLGKRIMGIKIISTTKGLSPSVSQLILRNITLLILPIDLFFLFKNSVRLGDKIAKTDVVRVKHKIDVLNKIAISKKGIQ